MKIAFEDKNFQRKDTAHRPPKICLPLKKQVCNCVPPLPYTLPPHFLAKINGFVKISKALRGPSGKMINSKWELLRIQN